MKMKTIFQASLTLGFLASSLYGAPSSELPGEWASYLENEPAIVVAQKETGQVRILKFSPSNELTHLGPIQTSAPSVSGLTTGINSDDVELLAISSSTSNAVQLLSGDLSFSERFFSNNPGPSAVVPLKQNSGSPERFYLHSSFADGGHALELWNSATMKPLALLRQIDESPLIHSFQPLFVKTTGERNSLFLRSSDEPTDELVEHRLLANKPIEEVIAKVPKGSRLATEIIGDDGRLCAITFLPGIDTVEITTLPHNGFPTNSQTSNKLPFGVGSILAVPQSIPEAEEGLLITSSDGKTSAYAVVDEGKNIEIVEVFQADPDKKINALVPVPGLGFLTLTNSKGGDASDGWDLFRPEGGWKKVASGILPEWLEGQENFATFFWFDNEALVDPSAQLIGLETRSDWSEKKGNASIPETVNLSRLSSPDVGLTDDGSTSPEAPEGANFLLTNQFDPNASVSALGSNTALSTPFLEIAPASGNYQRAITIIANYDDDATTLFFRSADPGAAWQPFEGLTVSYSSELLFYVRNNVTGVPGPILNRSYNFSPGDLNSFDSDGDGVPNYIEEAYLLDPTAGADSDGDFQSDLEEILAGTDPNDPDSRSQTADRQAAFMGEGFQIWTRAFTHSTGSASPGEDHLLHDMHNNLLATEPVELISGTYAARFVINVPVSRRGFVTASSPTYFSLGTGANPPRSGRENVRVLPRPITELPEIDHNPGGINLLDDRDTWLVAAREAYDGFEAVSEVTEIRPIDNAVSVIFEQAIFNSLQALEDGEEKDALNIPETIAEFSLFGYRDGDSGLAPLTSEMTQALISSGCDFRAMIDEIRGGVLASAPLSSITTSLYVQHRDQSESNPLMLLPLDALRAILRTGSIPDTDESDEPRPNPYAGVAQSLVINSQSAMETILSNLNQTKRPTDTWTLTIAPSTDPLTQYDYIRQSNNERAWLVDLFGDREELEQGLGLPLGTIFEITGFTDVTGPDGYDTMEVISIDSVISPLASNSDQDGNLLDDEWELFFFGELGQVTGLDAHPVTGHTYLQYQISGNDPRSGQLDGPIAILAPQNVKITKTTSPDGYEVSFDFPADYLDEVDFKLSTSTNLENFAGNGEFGNLLQKGPNRWALRISSLNLDLARNFFRVEMALSSP